MAASGMPASLSQSDKVDETNKKGSPETKPNSSITSIRRSQYINKDFSQARMVFKINTP